MNAKARRAAGRPERRAASSSFGAALLGLALTSGCYHYRVQPAQTVPADEPHRATRHAFFWGAVQNPALAPDCMGNGVAEVHASTNFVYALATIATLGIWAPLDLEWRCAKDRLIVDSDFRE